mgnify:FL=1
MSINRAIVVATAEGRDVVQVADYLHVSPKLVQYIVNSPLACAEIARLQIGAKVR